MYLAHGVFVPEHLHVMLDPQKPERGHRALRKGRYSEKNRIYHITTNTVNREPIFSDFSAGRRVVHALKYQDEAGHTETLTFVVMPDHLHWLVRLAGNRDLPTCIGFFKSYSSRLINESRSLRTPVWQRCFHDHALRTEENIEDVARYIVANPLRAGLVTRLGDYPLWDAIWV